MSGILQPTGTLASSTVKADKLFYSDGSTRLSNTDGALAMVAPDIFTATAAVVKAPSASHTTAETTFGALTITGVTDMTSAAVPIVTATNTVSSNVLQSIVTATDTLVVDAKKVVLASDVLVSGRIDVIDTDTMQVQDKTVALGAIDANGDGVDDGPADLTRDGAGLVIAGPPAHLPGGKDAAKYEHSVKWRVHGGDFSGGGAPVVAHLKPIWEFAGAGVAIACPDAADRMARFVFAPSFTSTSASLGMYYAVGEDAYLVQSFSTTPLPI